MVEIVAKTPDRLFVVDTRSLEITVPWFLGHWYHTTAVSPASFLTTPPPNPPSPSTSLLVRKPQAGAGAPAAPLVPIKTTCTATAAETTSTRLADVRKARQPVKTALKSMMNVSRMTALVM